MTDPIDLVVAGLFLGPLAVAACWDVACFRIPNWLTAALALAFPLAAAVSPVAVALGWHVAAGLGVLAAGFGLFALGLIGGGDAKLMAAAALWLGIKPLALFLLVVSVGGALLTLVLLVLRLPPLRVAVAGLGVRAAVLRPRAGIPYGVAIAAAGTALVGSLPLLGD